MGQKEFVLSFELDGQVYNLTPDDFTAWDDHELKRATGMSLAHIFMTLSSDPSVAGIAALLWRYRVNDGETGLTFEDVARSFPFAAIKTVSNKQREGEHPKA